MTTLSRSIEFIKPIIDARPFGTPTKPLVVGISGPQGSGKSFLTNQFASDLKVMYPKMNIVLFLMDDLYLTHDDQLQLTRTAREQMGDNKLLMGRGLPGTHDIDLGSKLLNQLLDEKSDGEDIAIPFYDKSAFDGEGDRSPMSNWTKVKTPVDIIIFEGWFNGFKPLSIDQLRFKYSTSNSDSILKRHELNHIERINGSLEQYAKIWSLFDYFIYFETNSLQNVYRWRLEQEHCLIKSSPTGAGMTDAEVVKFVDRYMPIYELYYQNMCEAGCIAQSGSNLKLVIDENRNMTGSISY